MSGMGCALYIRCALSIHQKTCRKCLGCALYIGSRYILENKVCGIEFFGENRVNAGNYFQGIFFYRCAEQFLIR
jgi:hypothetical protein